MKTLTLTDEEYAALDRVIGYTMENDSGFGHHVYLDAGEVADALYRNEEEASRG